MPRCPRCDYWNSREAEACEHCARDLRVAVEEGERDRWVTESRARAAQNSGRCAKCQSPKPPWWMLPAWLSWGRCPGCKAEYCRTCYAGMTHTDRSSQTRTCPNCGHRWTEKQSAVV